MECSILLIITKKENITLIYEPGDNPIEMRSLAQNNHLLTLLKTLVLIQGLPCLSSTQHSMHSNANYKLGVNYLINVSSDHKARIAWASLKDWIFLALFLSMPWIPSSSLSVSTLTCFKIDQSGRLLPQEKWTLFLNSCYILVSTKLLSKRQKRL